MKVLQFIPSLNISDGGTTTYMQQLTPVLGRVCELHVCAMGKTSDFVPLEGCFLHNISSNILHYRRMRKEWIRLLEEIRPDIVHFNCCWLPQTSFVTFWTKEFMRTTGLQMKLFLTPHGMLEPWIMHRNYWTKKVPAMLLYQRRSIKMYDYLVATAVEEREHLLELGWNKSIALIQNGIDVDGISVKTAWKSPHDLLFMSRIHPKKGLELLIDALYKIRTGNQVSSFHLTIAGEGDNDYVRRLKSSVEEKDLSSFISFIGPVYGDDKWMLIRAADIVILPSYSENYGLIIAESLASGTPVITTTGTPWQSVISSGCGWWINPDVQSLYQTLVQLNKLTANDLAKMGKAARRLAEMDCTISTKVYQLYQLYLSKNL